MTVKWTPLGLFKHRIGLQKLKEPPDRGSTGEIIKQYVTYALVHAAFRTLSGQERLAAEQVASVLTHEVAIHYRQDVTPAHRILWGTRIFDIKDVRNIDEENIELRMRCTEVLA